MSSRLRGKKKTIATDIEASVGHICDPLSIGKTYKKNKMIYITQLIYIKEGQEIVFHQFEDVAIPLIGRYNGKLLLRVRPAKDAYIESWIDRPYEIHLVEFDSEQDFKSFMIDEERKKFLHLKEQSIKSSILYKGVKL